MPANIRVVVLEPGQPGRVEEIPDTLEGLQQLVGGYVEMFYDSAAGAFVYCDEDGEMKKLPPNRQIGAHDVVGTAVFCRHAGTNTVSLTDADVTRIRALYG